MKKDKIKYVIIQPEVLTQRWESYLHLDELSAFFDIEFWDCSALVLPHYESKGIERPYAKKIESDSHFLKELQSLPKDSMIVLDRAIFKFKENLSMLKTLSVYFPKQLDIDFYTGNQLMASLWSTCMAHTINTGATSIEQNERQISQHISIKSVLKNIKRWLYKSDFIYLAIKRMRYLNDNKSYKDILENYCYRKSEELFQTVEISYRKDSPYPVNPPDYEQYLTLGQGKKGNTIVFIDQAFPIHPEFSGLYKDLNIPELAKEYQQSLRLFFDRVERQTGLRVVIAGHPVANYQSNVYGDREIIYYKTAELVRDAAAVFIHSSHAINFPIFYNKPMVFLQNAAWQKAVRHYNHLLQVAQYFDKPVINTDDDVEIAKYLTPVDAQVRAKYMDSMIDKRTEGKFNADLFKEYLVQIHDEMYK